jgi:hypothetical protein
MSTTCKSPRKVLQAAYVVAKESLPAYAHRYSPKKFTQHQLFACLVLKAHLKTDYRGVTAFLDDLPDLQQCIELKKVPHFTTLQKTSVRLLRNQHVLKILNTTVRRVMKRKRRVPLAAADSSGFDVTHASRYYVWRAKRMGLPPKSMTYRRYPKLHVIIDTRNHLILSLFGTRGPTPDTHQLGRLFGQLGDATRIGHLLADAGYDSEANHALLREEHGIRSTIPPKQGRPRKDGVLPSGRYRRLMSQRFDTAAYRQRSQVETVMSMLKRNLDGCVRARTYWSQIREMGLKVLTHNLMIFWLFRQVFYRAGRTYKKREVKALFPRGVRDSY